MGTNPLTAEEKELVDRFYDAACDFRSESFTRVATRVLGAAGFTGGHGRAVFRLACEHRYRSARGDKVTDQQ